MLMARNSVLLEDVEEGVKTFSTFAAKDLTTLSDMIIPAKLGEFYSYTSEFTAKRPIFVFMKCKANKNRPIKQLPNLGSEANIFFQFGDPIRASAHSIRSAHSLGLLGSPAGERLFGETWLASSNVVADEFYEIHSHKDVGELVKKCQEACSEHETVVELNRGSIIAAMTSQGKYGMFQVQNITPLSIQIVACHILL